MTISIQNDQLTAAIRLNGAELDSLVNKCSGEEYIWQANPDVWGSSAPILFPVTGVLRDGTTIINGEETAVPRHGILRGRTFKVLEQQENSVTLALSDTPETLAVYPFKFEFLVTFTLVGNKLEVRYEAKNLNDHDMLGSIGSHPAFRLPTGNPNDYQLHIHNTDEIRVDDCLASGLIGLRAKPYPLTNECLQLTSSIFDNDALVVRDQGIRAVSLQTNAGEKRLTMSWDNTPHLGLWAKPNAAFVCIEPWQSYSDTDDSSKNFAEKPGISVISTKQSLTDGYTIEIH